MGCAPSKEDTAEITSTPYQTVYEVKGVKDVDGNPVDMAKFQDKVSCRGRVHSSCSASAKNGA
jgi:hypothetical protein